MTCNTNVSVQSRKQRQKKCDGFFKGQNLREVKHREAPHGSIAEDGVCDIK